MTWPGALVCLVLRHHLCPSSWLVFLRVRGQPPESTCLDHFQVRFCWPSSLQACLPPEQARFTRDHRYVPYTGIRHWWYCDCDCTVLLIFTFLGPFFFSSIMRSKSGRPLVLLPMIVYATRHVIIIVTNLTPWGRSSKIPN
jgi:hypothetical protein